MLCCVFFIPVILAYAVVEIAVANIPNKFSIKQNYMETHAPEIETLVFGSSQIEKGINPAFLKAPAINLSSAGQHHNTDFEILKGVVDRFPNLKTVVFEVSYGHFELRHNSKYFWKHNIFLKYYHVNTFDRPTTPKDSLLFLAHPGKFSEILLTHYVKDTVPDVYNKFGFDLNHYEGKFKKLSYDSTSIVKKPVKIYKREDPKIFEHNSLYFYDMVEFCLNRGLNVVILSPPTFPNYNALRNGEILKRRDSILQDIVRKYDHVYFLNTESDSDFKVEDFRNENHLNPKGAEKLTKKLNTFLKKLEE
ncbi:hypothetical protein DDV96_15085 [Marixanthomonas spongiae]|uniref:SGNH/GDSL hydrolase family protein n=2 Tax=Marixanthomonas spongiae TaxID=2174845 RepID=A0A2U0HU17_9FLAO|nr:hypothetical protein DDV96_15085 [Marixanthomonas spongiae]